MITVLSCRGTGERLGAPGNLLTAVTGRLDPAKYSIGPEVDYPASIGPANPQYGLDGCSEEQSIDTGVRALAAAVRATPNRAGLLGYSLGAEVVTRFLEAKARGEYADCDIAWAANIANPLRREGDSIDPNPVGFGINGQREPWPDCIPTWEVANPADCITSCPADSPLRTLADTLSAFSFAEFGGWTRAMVDRLRVNRWQPTRRDGWTRPVRTWRMWEAAAASMEGYLSGGQHNLAYQRDGYCERLADILNAHEELPERLPSAIA
ncbi:PE-PPE domain-containing protein [Nocardia sp. NBC_01503]|uniref:PE-PPE domain-containing protein n=1 Tax=Nocardia sp. NBC_01503 TaxID=2975997 RepID=UPI002E7AE009|nr:PE-PPE domain-containing protein [Nocardia sp. NBC_01503]WTL35606.1 PE-PPE domain-containing protein [Nocardia sp. NBC_01503]